MKAFIPRFFKGIISEKNSHDWKKSLGIFFAILAIIFGSLWYVSSGWGSFVILAAIFGGGSG